jgi:hypothetical protein
LTLSDVIAIFNFTMRQETGKDTLDELFADIDAFRYNKRKYPKAPIEWEQATPENHKILRPIIKREPDVAITHTIESQATARNHLFSWGLHKEMILLQSALAVFVLAKRYFPKR